ncbi:rRNA maturation RNase YbeY [Rohdeia mirabilis]|uniref:rRNA maturation RNase YbeY n=1 Tax=Rohdeia mirabilis TaxID=2528008 RepID=UPI003AF40444
MDRPAGIDDASIARAATAALAFGGRAGAVVNVVLVDEPTLTRMHVELFDDPAPTDVITVDLGPGASAEEAASDVGPIAVDPFDELFPDDDGPDGELFVSIDRARDVAVERGVSLARETCLYVVHGALHLCGYDDNEPAERARMRAAERDVLRSLGYEDDPLPHDQD